MFFGKLNGTNPNELNKKIDYTKTGLEERMEVVDDILESGFYEEYMDEIFKVHLNSSDALSDSDAACNSLERLANYLLNSDEVKAEKKEDDFEYKFYADEEAFNKAVNKEPNIDGMGNPTDTENIIHFLKKENRNYKLPKNQRILKNDYVKDEELGIVLSDYADYLEKVTNELNNHNDSLLSRFTLSGISGSVKQDMIDSKNILLGSFGFKTKSEESCVIDWNQIDFTNKKHSRAMLYMNPGKRADEDLEYIIEDFNKLLKKAKPTKLQRDIIVHMRENKGTTEIGNELNITKQRVEKNIAMLVKRICKEAKKHEFTYRD
jgi:hypothetical protein